MERIRKFSFSMTVILSLMFTSDIKAEIYTIKIGTNYYSLYNLCIGDTLRFIGDSVNTNAYGSVQGNVYNNRTSNYDNFNIVSYTNLATSYDHILELGDTSFFYNLGTFNSLTDGHLYFNCLSTNITHTTIKADQYFFPNPFSTQTVLRTNEILKEATIILYNEYGQLVKQFDNISGQTIIFNRNNLSNGIYFYRLTQDSKIISENKLLITD